MLNIYFLLFLTLVIIYETSFLDALLIRLEIFNNLRMSALIKQN
jgi:hypothetical protein